MNSFFNEAIRTIQTSGTIRPSSKYLIKECLRNLNFKNAKHIIEFGTGDGCITEALIRKKNKEASLYSFEINPQFHHHSLSRFSSHEKVHILKQSAREFGRVLEQASVTEVDFIISSLPLSLFDESEIQILLNKVQQFLKPGGTFVQYQYSLGKYGLLKESFDKVELNFTIRNLPPAFVYRC